MTPDAVNFPNSIRPSLWGAKSRSLARVVGALILLLSASLLGFQVRKAWMLNQATQDQAIRAQSLSYDLETAKIALQGNRSKIPNKQSFSAQDFTKLSKMYSLLNQPWAEIFKELEQKTPKGIAIVSLEPGDKDSIKMQSESPHIDLLLVYAATLQNNGPFAQLLYSRHETNERDPNKPARLSFELALKKGGAP